MVWERLEGRTMFSSAISATTTTFVYTETNNAAGNDVLAYRRDAVDGHLVPLATSAFPTGGTGYRNAGALLGPDDSDHEVIASNDGRLLFAVNQGSNSVSTFRINPDGELELIGAFASGGTEPVSLALVGDYLYVANRGDEAGSSQGTVAPNYTAFEVTPGGGLNPVAGSTITLPVGASPATFLADGAGKLFANNFTAPQPTADNNVVIPFLIDPNGKLTAAPGGPVGAPGETAGAVLGLAKNPNRNILYAGLPVDGQVGVYTYDAFGRLTYIGAVGTGEAGACWLTCDAQGRFLYVADSAIDTVAVFSLANPLKPVEIQKLQLQGPINPSGSAPAGVQTVDFQIALDPTGRSLYVINHSVDDAFQAGNVLHTLTVNYDGKLSENVAPLDLPANLAPATAHPQGLAVVSERSFDWPDEGGDSLLLRALAAAGEVSPFSSQLLP